MSSVVDQVVDPFGIVDSAMGGGNEQPNLTSYGGGMKEALEAQLALLTGKKVGEADFSDVGSLEDLLPIEQSLREKSAQVDTDVLRSTLLGGDRTARVVKNDDGSFSVPNAKNISGEGRYQHIEIDAGVKATAGEAGESVTDRLNGRSPTYAILDTKTGGITQETGGAPTILNDQGQEYVYDNDEYKLPTDYNQENKQKVAGVFTDIENKIADAGGDESIALDDYSFKTEARGDGMIDLLGDSRNVQDTQSREVTTRKGGYAYTGDPNKPPGYRFDSDKDYSLFDDQGNEIASGLDLYQARAQSDDIKATTTTETVYEQSDTGRRAGFDAEGNFLGASAYAEDLAAGNLSRQRERDLLDVARLSGTYQDIMEDYKPGTQQALSDAREVLASQKDSLTGAGAITVPTDSTFASVGDVNVADPLQLQANTQFDQQLARGQGTLRSDILSDAQTALKQGLTPREERQIAEAARARSTMMGRTFDQSGAIAEAEARVAEDNARRMQNRAFAQSVLGQEAGLQQGDITRGMAQESEQAGLQQRADLVQSDVDLRSALANQAQLQQANQFGVGATMDAQRLNEQLSQQGTLGYIQAASNLAALEDQSTLDPFRAVLGRGGGQSLSSGQSVLGTAGYGLGSGPQFINPESGLGFIQNQNTNLMNMYNAQTQADAEKFSGLTSAAATAALAACWVAREVYGVHNPAWMAFRYWMLNESPSWFRATYLKYGERFARFIADKPRLKARIRMWMDSKIGR
jgi:hypothetical protein